MILKSHKDLWEETLQDHIDEYVEERKKRKDYFIKKMLYPPDSVQDKPISFLDYIDKNAKVGDGLNEVSVVHQITKPSMQNVKESLRELHDKVNSMDKVFVENIYEHLTDEKLI